MNISKFIFSLLFLARLISPFSSLLADPVVKELEANTNTELDFKLLPVDHPKNSADANGLGKVDTNFLIATFDTTAEQYCAFLNAVETTDAHGFYHPEMSSDPSVKCISRSLAEDGIHFIYKVIDNREKLPITYVSWIDAVCFCNWLHHDCPTGDQVTDEVLYSGAYLFSKEGEEEIIELQPDARYFLPDKNQFHKAAFYRPQIDAYWNYPTKALSPFGPGNTIGSSPNQANYYYTSYFWGNSHSTKEPPYVTSVGAFSGSPGPFGTYDMGSNVKNWSSNFDQDGEALAEGGSWKTRCEMLENNAPETPLDPTIGYDDVGFRIAALAAHITDEAVLAEQDDKMYKPSYANSISKNLASAVEWTFWNIGGEIVEAVAFQQLGLYVLAPYCIYMGAIILNEYEHQEYYAAAGTIVHALFDIACIFGDKIGFDVAGILGSCLDQCGLKFVADFFRSIHQQIDRLLHVVGIEHSHGTQVENTAPLVQEIGDELRNVAHNTSSPNFSTVPPVASNVSDAGWGHQCKGSCSTHH